MNFKTKRKLQGWAVSAIGLLAFSTIVGLAIYMEVGFWTECRATNSFWYCMRVLSK